MAQGQALPYGTAVAKRMISHPFFVASSMMPFTIRNSVPVEDIPLSSQTCAYGFRSTRTSITIIRSSLSIAFSHRRIRFTRHNISLTCNSTSIFLSIRDSLFWLITEVLVVPACLSNDTPLTFSSAYSICISLSFKRWSSDS